MLRQVVCPYVRATPSLQGTQLYLLAKIIIFHQFSTFLCLLFEGQQVSFGIALQNIPEGMVIIAPLMMAGVTAVRTFFISIFIALLEVVGILLGFGLGSASSSFLPVMLGFAGGAMLYVTSDEMIPETHAHGFQKQATYALLLGFITFVLMEKCV